MALHIKMCFRSGESFALLTSAFSEFTTSSAISGRPFCFTEYSVLDCPPTSPHESSMEAIISSG
ncbi:hypothetical protein Bhyg_12221 [Pseudolycoriella hygida]|uniref:Uncharacterized protein n=1 Tax=Pseudolycoriella hygida TaxID=35572 RepID=A0A9Q0MWT2_9DIPT|nr:hypothetical protein Bhyg_12221 [Pseudolycoriella hygida]